ncbi:hypothetical protein V2I01_04885 [Micromonospora sp. BRA006-A]|nr:hypothetical protein [Micromonospora sp. BRA006-A]
MSTALMEKLRKELADALTPARDIAAKAEAEKRDLTDEERTRVTDAVKTANGIKARIDQAKRRQRPHQAARRPGRGHHLRARLQEPQPADRRPVDPARARPWVRRSSSRTPTGA